MTYSIQGAPYRRPRRGGLVAMGDTAVPKLPSNASSVEAIADYLVKTWKPTGFYTPDQMAQILSQCEKIYLSVVTPIRAYRSSSDTFAKDVALQLETRMFHNGYEKFVMANQQVVRTARAKGAKYIDAPGFRQGVISFLYLMSNGVDGLATIKRVNEEEWGRLPMAREILSITTSAANLIIRVGGVAIDVIKEAGETILEIPDTAATMFKVIKWGILLMGGAWIYGQVREHKSSGGG